MGAKLSRKKSEGGTGAETTGPALEQNEAADGSPVAKNAEQKPSEDEVLESALEETKPVEEAPTEEPDSSTSFLETITQAVEETVNTVTEQIAAPVEDVVNKGIKAVESAFAAVNLNAKEPAAPEQEPEHIQESKPEPLVDLSASGTAPLLSESTLLDDLLKSQQITAALTPELDSEVRVKSETITSQMVEDIINNPAPTENKDLLECLDKVVTPSVDLLDCKLTHESIIPNLDPSVTLGDVEQVACEASDAVDLI